jgi:hypothetical protein
MATDSASLKIDRAAKHVSELNELLRKNRPFVLVVQTYVETGQRTAFTKKNAAIINEIALATGDVIHNLRSALDHAYFGIVSPHCTSDKERRIVQFPFTSKALELRKTIIDGYAQRAGTGFFCAMLNLRPHGEAGGNEMLYLIREADNLDKHRLLIPAVDYTSADGNKWKAAFPDIPFNIAGDASNLTLALSSTTIRWVQHNVPLNLLGRCIADILRLYEREIDLKPEVVLQIGALGRIYPLVPTLNQMIDAVRDTVAILRAAAMSY